MNGRQERVFRSIEVAMAFGLSRRMDPELVAAHADIARAYEKINKANVRGIIAGADRELRRRRLRTARLTLRQQHLLKIRKRGKFLLRGLSGIERELRVPHYRASNEDLLAAARRIAKAVRPHAAVFYEANFPKDFLKQLKHAADAVARAAAEPIAPEDDGPLITRALKEALREGRLAVDAFDALVVAKYAKNSGELHAWKGSKKIRGRMGRPPKPKPPKRQKRRAAFGAG
jgi:hypothetical protein